MMMMIGIRQVQRSRPTLTY